MIGVNFLGQLRLEDRVNCIRLSLLGLAYGLGWLTGRYELTNEGSHSWSLARGHIQTQTVWSLSKLLRLVFICSAFSFQASCKRPQHNMLTCSPISCRIWIITYEYIEAQKKLTWFVHYFKKTTNPTLRARSQTPGVLVKKLVISRGISANFINRPVICVKCVLKICGKVEATT